ncbi:MAG: hypothetical protein PHF86_01070 [Candidatus Nanoarchaeia archaeon]|nr:hypothetical protein [Candidatus Nanoarchaeia archaeon]
MKKILIFLLLSLSCTLVFPQDGINVSADLVNRFFWRGQNVGGNSFHLQPLVYYSKSHFEIGAFGSYGFCNKYEEVDLYAKFKLKDFAIAYTNYYIPIFGDETPSSINTKFYNFGKTTPNIGEVSLSYKSESFPLFGSINTFIWGNDKNFGYDAELDSTGGNYYSTYAELGYSFNKNINLFVGLTPYRGFYGNDFGVVNVGLKVYKNIEVTDKFNIPVYVVLSSNPQKENLFLMIGITL